MARDNEINCVNNVISAFKREGCFHIESCNCNDTDVLKVLQNLKEPSDANQFPDFIFNGGIVEHFAVAGYKESRKGSEFKIEESKGNKKTETFFKEEDKKFSNSPRNPGTYHTISHENTYSNSVYKDFLSSFKRSFNNHLESLQKSKHINETVIFLIEQEDVRFGIYQNNRFTRFYLLSEDKSLLMYLKEQYPLVNYVIFNSADSVEIIDLSNLEPLISRANEGLDIRSGRKRELSLKIYWDL